MAGSVAVVGSAGASKRNSGEAIYASLMRIAMKFSALCNSSAEVNFSSTANHRGTTRSSADPGCGSGASPTLTSSMFALVSDSNPRWTPLSRCNGPRCQSGRNSSRSLVAPYGISSLSRARSAMSARS